MTRITTFTLGILLAVSTAVMAHARLQTSQPASGATVKAGPTTVTLNYTEEVHTPSSVFKICAVKDDAAASELEKTALTARANPTGQVAATVSPATGDSKTVSVAPAGPLQPGTYAVLWKVLASDDGHVTHGHFLFHVSGK